MAHLVRESLHTYRARAIDVQVDVATPLVPGDFSNVEFEVAGVVTKAALAPLAGGDGILVDLTLEATEVDVEPGIYRYELTAVVGGQLRTLAVGALTVSVDPAA